MNWRRLEIDELQRRLSELSTLPFVEQVRLKRLIVEYRDELSLAAGPEDPGGLGG